MIKFTKGKTINFCDKLIEIFLYVLIFCLPFSKALIEISATFIIFAWIAKKISSAQPSAQRINLFNFIKAFKPVPTYLSIPIVAYILATLLSVLFSTNFSLSLGNFGSKTMEYILLYFIVVEFVSDKKRLKNCCLVMLASAAMIITDCIFQYSFGVDFLRFWQLEAGRITGSFQMPGDLAGFLGPVLCLSLSLSFLRLKGKIKYFLRVETIFLMILLITTLSRGALVGFIVAVFFLGMKGGRKIIYLTLTLLLVLGILLPYVIESPHNMFGRLKSIFVMSETANLDRKAMWQVAVRMIKAKPVFGHGLSTFMGNFPKYGKDYYHLKHGIIPYAHNCYLQIAAETGIIGLASFLWLSGAFLIHTIIFLGKNLKDRFLHAVLAGISAGIIVTLVHSAVDTNLYSLQLSVLFWLMLGLNAAIQQNFTPLAINDRGQCSGLAGPNVAGGA